jgi:hypothetical protein
MPIEWAAILVVAVSDAILLAATSFRLDASSELRILAGLIPLAVVPGGEVSPEQPTD